MNFAETLKQLCVKAGCKSFTHYLHHQRSSVALEKIVAEAAQQYSDQNVKRAYSELEELLDSPFTTYSQIKEHVKSKLL